MENVLWQIEISHYNEKARWALDYKGIPHRRRAPLPGLHRAWALAITRGSHDRLPVLRLDGRIVAGSSAIVAAVDAHTREPPLLPADPGERTRALELESYFDEELAPRVRRFVWWHTLDNSEVTLATVAPNAGAARRRLLSTLAPAIAPVMKRDYKINAASAPEARDGILAAADRLERELGSSGYLVGDSFSVADLAGASLFTPLICPPERPYPPTAVAEPVLELRAELEAREAGAWVRETYRRHRGVSAEIAA